jgi:aryl-alcohol dehydrogenase-like predicted oxidoreductase
MTHHPTDSSRRRLLAAATTLGVAPWLLSACAQTAGAPGAAAGAKTGPSTAARRRLGPFDVYPIGLGVQWHPGQGPQSVTDLYASRTTRQGGIALIQRAADLGVNLFDTAEVYGPFMSEELLGEALQGSRRDRAVISTKFGFDVDLVTGQRRGSTNSRPEHIRQVVEAQLRRLRTDRIDLLYQHRVDPNVPIEDVVGAIKDLIRQGKVLHYGLSEPGLQTVRRAHREHPVAVIQNEYSMLWRGPEAQVLPLCEGFLAGTVHAASRFERQDFRASVPRFAPDALPANMALADLVKTWAARKNITSAQLSLAWLSAQKPWIVPIPGTTNVAHLEENIAAASVNFGTAELKELNAAVAAIPIRGERLSPAVLSATGVEAPPKR